MLKRLFVFFFGLVLTACAPNVPARSSRGAPDDQSSIVAPTAPLSGGQQAYVSAADDPSPEPPGPVRHVIVVTIDGLMPSSYLEPAAHGLDVPNLRRLAAEGAVSDGALSVFPSLTYPAHTSIASGVNPARHGITTNSAFDPMDVNQKAWRWYDADVHVPRLWDVAYAAGYRTAVLDWPVTVGETATFHVPEFWRAHVEDDIKLIDALSTPGLLDAVSSAYPTFREGFRPQDVSDESGTDMALYAIEKGQPHVLFLHIWQVDAAQHHHGIGSDRAKQAIEVADAQVGRLIHAIEQAGIADESVLVVASDHGFASVRRCVNPSYLLRRAGLLAVDGEGQVREWKAAALPSHGIAYIYLADPNDAELQAATLAVFERAKQRGNSGIARIVDQRGIAELGGDPNAFLALEADAGVYFGTGREQYETKAAYQATHGYDPHQPAMKASLLFFGRGVKAKQLEGARLIDIAPTLASLLGLSLGEVDGTVLDLN